MAERSLQLPDVDKALDSTKKTMDISDIPSFNIGSNISTKETVIAIGAVFISTIIFFIVKNFVSKMLVSNYRKSPRIAEMAGWSLFCVLFFAAIASALVILDPTRFVSLPYLLPIGLAMLVSLVMFIVALLSRR